MMEQIIPPLSTPQAAPSRRPSFLGRLGPGLITGASDDDPSGIATYSQVGAQFGYGFTWTMLFTFPLMAAVQEISAQLGRVTGKGIAGNIRRLFPRGTLAVMVLLLFVANTINIGADLAAMAEIAQIMTGGPQILYAVVFAVFSAGLQIWIGYDRYVGILKWLTLSLFSYFFALLTIDLPWLRVLRGALLPAISFDSRFLTSLVAVLGTTISPYLFFWQASNEVEEIHAIRRRKPLRIAPDQASSAIHRIRFDTWIGMALSNLVAAAIMVTTAATLHEHGVTNVESAAQAAQALRPVAGDLAFALFGFGIVGTGLLAIPVLAGSAAFALGEALDWRTGLARRPGEAPAFYGAIALACLLGAAMSLLGINPIRALFYSAVLNGVVAAPVMVMMMVMSRSEKIMGQFKIGGWLYGTGWIATLVMSLAVLFMLVAFALGWGAT